MIEPKATCLQSAPAFAVFERDLLDDVIPDDRVSILRSG